MDGVSEDPRVVMGALIAMMGAQIPKANKGFNGNRNLSRGEYTFADALEASRRMLAHADRIKEEGSE